MKFDKLFILHIIIRIILIGVIFAMVARCSSPQTKTSELERYDVPTLNWTCVKVEWDLFHCTKLNP